MNFKQLKLFAIGCMLFDHVTALFPIDWMMIPLADRLWNGGYGVLADQLTTWIPFAFSFVGRLAAPVFLFCIVNGFFHTRSVKRYIARIAVTAAVAQVPYVLFDLARARMGGYEASWRDVGLNILVTLAVGLSAIAAYDYFRKRKQPLIGLLTVAAAAALCHFLPSEGKEGYILLIFLFYLLKESSKMKKAAVFLPGVVLSRLRLLLFCIANPVGGMVRTMALNIAGNYLGLLVPVLFYNGEKGKTGVWFQRFSYAFYPLHLLLLAGAGFLLPPLY